MVRRICPVCDQVMHSAHYCRTCKSLVKNPWIREVDYYLNERHPQHESDCSYHDAAPQQPGRWQNQGAAPGQTVRPQKSGPSAIPNVSRQMPSRPNTAGRTAPDYRQTRATGEFSAKKNQETIRNKKSMNLAVVIIIAVYLLFMIAGGGMLGRWGGNILNHSGYDIDLGDDTVQTDAGSEYDPEDGELTDEEVITAGERCSSQGHFAVEGELLHETLMNELAALGYEIEDDYEYSYNTVWNGESSYETVYCIDLVSEAAGSYQFAEVNRDTVTGELHGVEVMMEDGSDTVAVAVAALECLETLGVIPEEQSLAETAGQEISQAVENEMSTSYIYGDVDIMVSCYDGSFWISIYHVQ